jgi:hypothetical protein
MSSEPAFLGGQNADTLDRLASRPQMKLPEAILSQILSTNANSEPRKSHAPRLCFGRRRQNPCRRPDRGSFADGCCGGAHVDDPAFLGRFRHQQLRGTRLEHRSLVIGSGCGLDKFRDRLMALGFAPRQTCVSGQYTFSSQATIILLLSTALVLPLITSRNRWNCRSICASSMRCATNC